MINVWRNKIRKKTINKKNYFIFIVSQRNDVSCLYNGICITLLKGYLLSMQLCNWLIEERTGNIAN
jgi:hypothetical protein